MGPFKVTLRRRIWRNLCVCVVTLVADMKQMFRTNQMLKNKNKKNCPLVLWCVSLWILWPIVASAEVLKQCAVSSCFQVYYKWFTIFVARTSFMSRFLWAIFILTQTRIHKLSHVITVSCTGAVFLKSLCLRSLCKCLPLWDYLLKCVEREETIRLC
jgi:hypothetical protein